MLNKKLSRFVDTYNCVWKNADWSALWHISTKSYQWQWKCGCSLTSCTGHHSEWMQFNVMPRTPVTVTVIMQGWRDAMSPHCLMSKSCTSQVESKSESNCALESESCRLWLKSRCLRLSPNQTPVERKFPSSNKTVFIIPVIIGLHL